MIRLLVFRFWPALIPLIVYTIWHRCAVKKARAQNAPLPRFRDGPWYWMVLASLLFAALCFIFWGAEAIEGIKGSYTPPHMENGQIVPAEIHKE